MQNTKNLFHVLHILQDFMSVKIYQNLHIIYYLEIKLDICRVQLRIS